MKLGNVLANSASTAYFLLSQAAGIVCSANRFRQSDPALSVELGVRFPQCCTSEESCSHLPGGMQFPVVVQHSKNRGREGRTRTCVCVLPKHAVWPLAYFPFNWWPGWVLPPLCCSL